MKKVEIEGLGKIFLSGVEFKNVEGTPCDAEGNPLIRFSEGGGKGKSGWKDKNGNIVAGKDIHRKMNIKGEDKVFGKLKATTTIGKVDVREKTRVEVSDSFADGGERKLYVATTDSKDLRALLDDGKGLVFPFVAGAGHKAWKGNLFKKQTKKGKEVFVLGLTRGSIDGALDSFADEPIEVEIGVEPNNENVRALVDLD